MGAFLFKSLLKENSKLWLGLMFFFSSPAFASGDFLWGVSSSAYQTEGAFDADGKGLSNWDYLTHLGITKYYKGEIYNADVAADGYANLEVDVALLKKLGVNSYRFSVAWSRVLPDGEKINPSGLEYYRRLVSLLRANGIRPMITIYHWDMPLGLYQQGGQKSKQFIKYYRRYANVLFDNFGDSADFITFNEPIGEVFELNPMTAAFAVGDVKSAQAVFTSEKSWVAQANAAHNVLLAHTYAVSDFHRRKLPGKIGITLQLSPQIPQSTLNKNNVRAAELNSELRNQWFLEPIFFGHYPTLAANRFKKLGWKLPSQNDMVQIKQNKPDFIGVNYYAPTFVVYDKAKAFGVSVLANTDENKSFNGPARPASLYDLLLWLDKRYSHPRLVVTEVGAGFGEADEVVTDGAINDALRSKFIVEHADAALRAKRAGVDLNGFYVWSLLDNFEWMCGNKCRFGLVHVGYENNNVARLPKKSFYEYQQLIQAYRRAQ